MKPKDKNYMHGQRNLSMVVFSDELNCPTQNHTRQKAIGDEFKAECQVSMIFNGVRVLLYA